MIAHDTFSVISPLLNPIHHGLDELDSLVNVYKSLEIAFRSLHCSLKTIHDKYEVKISNPITPLSNTLLSLKSHLEVLESQLSVFLYHLQYEIKEPLQIFSENLHNDYEDLIAKAKGLADPLLLAQTKLNNYKSHYYKNSEVLENMQRSLITEENRIQIEKQKEVFENIVNYDVQTCLYAEEELNEKHEDFDCKIPKLIETMKNNEETRCSFIKNTMEKYIFHMNL